MELPLDDLIKRAYEFRVYRAASRPGSVVSQ
jgi:hypothetical protein